jgi:hypothetical protein
MAATTTRSRAPASNGRGAAGPIEKVKSTGKGPAVTAGATLAGLAGGYALGSWKASRAPSGTRAAVRLAQGLGSLASEVASAGGDLRELRRQLKQMNRRSPVEVLLDGLTHRRGAHKNES